MLVTLPFVLLLLDYWPLKRFEIEHLKRFFLGDVEKQIENKNSKRKLDVFFFAVFLGATGNI